MKLPVRYFYSTTTSCQSSLGFCVCDTVSCPCETEHNVWSFLLNIYVFYDANSYWMLVEQSKLCFSEFNDLQV